MRNKTRRGIEAHDFDTSNKTNMNRHSGFAELSVSQVSTPGARNVTCGKCGNDGVRLYSGGSGRLALLCGDCLWPRRESAGDEAETPDKLADATDDVPGRTIRLVRCFVCDEPRAQSAMSIVPVICRACLSNDGSAQARRKIEKGLLRINRAIRRPACI